MATRPAALPAAPRHLRSAMAGPGCDGRAELRCQTPGYLRVSPPRPPRPSARGPDPPHTEAVTPLSPPPPPVMGAPRRAASARRLARPIRGAGGRGCGESRPAGPQGGFEGGRGPRGGGRGRGQCPVIIPSVPCVSSLGSR